MYAHCSPADVIGFAGQRVPLWLTDASSKQCFANHGGWAPDASAAGAGAQAVAAHAASESLPRRWPQVTPCPYRGVN